MARVWDPVDWDINKRCLRSSISNQLCGIHIKKLSSGRVDEYPSEKIVLRAYRKHKPNIDTLIDIKQNPFYNLLPLQLDELLWFFQHHADQIIDKHLVIYLILSN